MNPTFTILGARGSRPVCDPAFMRYGGNTTCFLLETEQGPLFIDAGTGLNRYRALATQSGHASGRPVTFLFTHFHLDHLAGLPSAGFLYRKKTCVRFFSDPARRPNGRATLSALLRPPFWPVELDRAGATLEYGDLVPGATPVSINGVMVSAIALRHPQGCLGLSLQWDQGRLVIATDHEPGDDAADQALADFARRADYLLMDAQYQPSQRAKYRGWGHGDWETAAAVAAAAEVRRLILIHHDPDNDDAALDNLEAEARKRFPAALCAREGMQWPCH